MTTPMTRRDAVRALAAIAAAALWGCASGEAGAPPMAAGEEECAWCRMLIDDTSLAAQLVPASARRMPFGEVGCLLAWMADHPDAAGTAWVFAGNHWLQADAASYDVGAVRTPMRFDITARVAAGGVSWQTLRSKGAPDVRST